MVRQTNITTSMPSQSHRTLTKTTIQSDSFKMKYGDLSDSLLIANFNSNIGYNLFHFSVFCFNKSLYYMHKNHIT